MRFRDSAIFRPYFCKSEHRKRPFPLFVGPVSKVFLLHIKTQHGQPKPPSFYFAWAYYMQAVLLSPWAFFLRDNFVLVVVVVAVVFRSSYYVLFSIITQYFHRISI